MQCHKIDMKFLLQKQFRFLSTHQHSETFLTVCRKYTQFDYVSTKITIKKGRGFKFIPQQLYRWLQVLSFHYLDPCKLESGIIFYQQSHSKLKEKQIIGKENKTSAPLGIHLPRRSCKEHQLA